MAEVRDLTLFDTRKLKGRDRRTQNLSTKLTEAEEQELQQVSAAEGKTVSEWAREVLLRSVRTGGSSATPDLVILTEVIGLQLFLMNVLSPLARGEHLTPEQYQNIIKTVQANKARATMDLIAKRRAMEAQ